MQALVAALEQENALPFGDRATQFSWIATLPEDLAATRNALVSDSQDRWAAVIDRFHERDTQFSDDVFWRVRSVRRIAARSSDNDTLSLRSRRTNIVGDPDAFQRDYRIAELGKYEVSIQTHTPGPTQRFPAGATVAFTPVEDEDGSIKLSPAPSVLRPEGNVAHRFTVATSGSPATRYPRMLLETQPQTGNQSTRQGPHARSHSRYASPPGGGWSAFSASPASAPSPAASRNSTFSQPFSPHAPWAPRYWSVSDGGPGADSSNSAKAAKAKAAQRRTG